jgi:hypothetical protein
MEKAVRKTLLFEPPVHCTTLLTQLVSDGRKGAMVCLQETPSVWWPGLVGLAHAWELLSQAPVPEAKRSSSLMSKIQCLAEWSLNDAVDPIEPATWL